MLETLGTIIVAASEYDAADPLHFNLILDKKKTPAFFEISEKSAREIY